MTPPPSLQASPGMVCRLRRALYGLKQAPRAWFEQFSSVVAAAVFKASIHDPAVFTTHLLEAEPFFFCMCMI